MYKRIASRLQATRNVDDCVGNVSMFWVWKVTLKGCFAIAFTHLVPMG